ncbi:hypothetical protein L2E82_45461 [Cichorium intybus]|uniref:Uncharacterized protein n=1 Tax=Cichorium intybus TaxID=13427 RepID=A0ACB8ZTD8_CICIN|nr:hypothetical protein L2E82_45461 [Cichorium intybus]
MESRFLADEVKALKETLETHTRELQVQAYIAHEVDKRTENTQQQLLWLADCMITLMAKNKCSPPRPQPTIRDADDEPMEEDSEEEEGDYDDSAHRVVSDKCGVTVPPPLVLTTDVFTVALQL